MTLITLPAHKKHSEFTDANVFPLSLPQSCGNWARDNQIGREFANDVAIHLRLTDNPTVLGHAVKALYSSPDHAGVAVGFMHRLSEIVISAE